MLREEILDSAQTLLTEKGYAAMSMDDLAAQVGISKPTLYSHFATKDDLVAAAAVRGMDRLLAVIETRPEEQSPLQHLVLVLRTMVQYQIDKGTMAMRTWTPEIFRVLCMHQDAAERLQRINTAIGSLIQVGIERGEIDPALDPATVMMAFHGLVGALHHTRFRNTAPDLNSVADTLAAIFERGIRAP